MGLVNIFTEEQIPDLDMDPLSVPERVHPQVLKAHGFKCDTDSMFVEQWWQHLGGGITLSVEIYPHPELACLVLRSSGPNQQLTCDISALQQVLDAYAPALARARAARGRTSKVDVLRSEFKTLQYTYGPVWQREENQI